MQREKSDSRSSSCGPKTDNYIPRIFLRLRYAGSSEYRVYGLLLRIKRWRVTACVSLINMLLRAKRDIK